MIFNAIIIIISCYLGSIALSGLLGFITAHYEDYTYEGDIGHPDLHNYYTAVRLIIFFFLSWLVHEKTIEIPHGSYYWWTTPLAFFISCMCTWSLFYNGVQYIERRELSGGKVYAKGFFAKKEKGEGDDKNAAKINMSFPLRAGLFGMGTIIVFIIIKSLVGL